jgi:hypothetical protein
VFLIFIGWGCKPSNEPTRRDDSPPTPDVQQAAPEHSDDAAVAALGSLRVVMQNDPTELEDGAVEEDDPPEIAASGETSPPGEDKRLKPEDLEMSIEQARVPADASAEEAAKRLNAQGLKHHKHLDFTKAIEKYRAALNAWPGHLYARYNLACALQLQRRPQEALDSLAILHGLQDRGGLDLLREARLDDDFSGARSELRFRELTGYLPVEVTLGADGASARLDPMVTKLRTIHIPATSGDRWPNAVERDTLYVRAEDNDANDMADEVADALGAQLERHVNARLGPRRPIVLVLANTPTAPPKKVEDAEHSPEAFIGVPLTREENGVLDRLHLKERRFFTWETRHDDGRRVGRTGTYYFLREQLHLDFQETTETPVEFGEPLIEVQRGKREHHPASTDGVTLTLSDLTFKRR